MMRASWWLMAAAALLAGCASAPSTSGPGAGPAGESVGAASVASGAGDAGAANATTNVTLYLTSDLALAAAPGASEATVALTTPVNSPFTGSYPTWKGSTPVAIANAKSVTLHLFATSSSVSLEANTLPVFADLPAMDARVTLGALAQTIPLKGPSVVRAGDVIELTATFAPEKAWNATAGAPASFQGTVYYSHVAGAGEWRYVVGGTAHASRIELS